MREGDVLPAGHVHLTEDDFHKRHRIVDDFGNVDVSVCEALLKSFFNRINTRVACVKSFSFIFGDRNANTCKMNTFFQIHLLVEGIHDGNIPTFRFESPNT